jgi:H/ACA ribonucleoprotein complex subunit 4
MDTLSFLSDSVVIIDKPCGPTSHEVSSWVKNLAGISRAGHADTLDPNVSGVLPVALGRATKLLRYIAGKRKAYMCIVRFKNEMSDAQLESLFSKFRGTITQTPPKISAVKKVPRRRTVHELRIMEREGKKVLFYADVDAGTYIRTICSDMGAFTGGSRMEELRRVSVGNIHEKQAVTLQDFSDALYAFKERKNPSLLLRILHPPDELIEAKKIFIRPQAAEAIMHGAQLAAPGVESLDDSIRKEEVVKLYCGDRFIGMGRTIFPARKIKERTHGYVVNIERIHAVQ